MRLRTLLFLALTILLFYGAYAFLRADEISPEVGGDSDPRGEERTLVTFPEWYIVYSAQEYAEFVRNGGRPSQFPYFKAIGQFWNSVDQIYAQVDPEKIDSESKTVIRVIGISFTVEYGLIGLYEKTIGRVSEALHLYNPSTEDRFATATAYDYGQFLTHTPWYDFPYFPTLTELWRTYGYDTLSPRSLERRLSHTIGYTLKGTYGLALGYLTQSAYGYVDKTTEFAISGISEDTLAKTEGVQSSEELDELSATGTTLRYRAFRNPALILLRKGGTFTEIEGNQNILITFLQPKFSTCFSDSEHTVLTLPLLTEEKTRIGLLVPVEKLGSTVEALDDCSISVEHIYDY